MFIDFRLLCRCLNERKIRFYRNWNIYSGARNIYSAGTFIRQHLFPNTSIGYAPPCIPPTTAKIRSRKGFRCCGRSFAAESRTKPRRGIMGRIDGRNIRGSINGSRQCGLAKSNRNCDQTLGAWRENGFRLKWNFKRLTDSWRICGIDGVLADNHRRVPGVTFLSK